MMLLISAEWMRFRRERNNLFVAGLLLVLLGAAAWFAGQAATDFRRSEAVRIAAWEQHLARHAGMALASGAAESAEAAKQAYEFGRGEAPPAVRPAGGGLVLAVQQFLRQPVDVKVSIDSRHLDPRRGAPLGNPLLDSFGVPDFAVAAALLLPLAVIALCYGIVHDAREQGIWMLMRAQSGSPARVLLAAMLVRFMVVFTAAGAMSALAFMLAAGSWEDYFIWLALLAVYTLTWTLLAGIANLLKISAGASALGLLCLWLLLNVVLPAWLHHFALVQAPMPSRETAVVKMRDVQHEADEKMSMLLEKWYAAHPGQRPAAFNSHTWPVSYVPKIIWQDQRIAPMLGAFADARAYQARVLEPLLWIAPGLALTRAADQLAGTDPAQYRQYEAGVQQLETRWRELIAPAVMSYRGLSHRQLDNAAAMAYASEPANPALMPQAARLLLLALAVTLAFAALAGRLRR